MASEWDGARPDIMTVGKALSGGMMPVSAVLCDAPLMEMIQPGCHGSTYGGNPLGMAVAQEAMKVLIEEDMIDNSLKMGYELEAQL
jgi:ornithine--oxo-acid transaminase